MLKKGIASLLIVSITLLSCDQNQKIINQPSKDFNRNEIANFTNVSGNAYESSGEILAASEKLTLSRIIELDNSLKYTFNNKTFSYYSFDTTVNMAKESNPANLEINIKNEKKELIKIQKPNQEQIKIMKKESLKSVGNENKAAIYSKEVAEKLFNNGVVFWQNENNFSFLIKSELIPTFGSEEYKKNLKTKLLIKSGDKLVGESLELIKSPIHIAVLGDSVMWGQGMNEKDKVISKISKYLSDQKKQNIRFKVLAHSGAKYGSISDNKNSSFHGELPSLSPSINWQLNQLENNYIPKDKSGFLNKKINQERLDLIIMNGGINNVGAVRIVLGFDPRKKNKDELIKLNQTILNEDSQQFQIQANSLARKILNSLISSKSSNKELKEDINKTFCFNENTKNFGNCSDEEGNIKKFYDKTRKTFPNAQIVIPGYFPVFTSSSEINCKVPIKIKVPGKDKEYEFNLGAYGLLAMIVYLASLPAGEPTASIIAGSSTLIGKTLLSRIKNLSAKRNDFWVNYSDSIFNKAVSIVNNENNIGRGKLDFISIHKNFGNRGSFSKDSYIWGFDEGLCQKDKMIFPPGDSYWANSSNRKNGCDNAFSNSAFEKQNCYRASLFHPNIEGYNNTYLVEIIKALNSINGINSRKDV